MTGPTRKWEDFDGRNQAELLCTRAFAHSTAFGLALAFSLAVTPAGPAHAQEGDDALGNVLEEVVVTARKREESLKDVPVSISVVSSDFINESGIRDQYDLFQLTPGINYGEERDRNGARPGVRGVQAQNQNPLRQKVSVFIDGMPVLTSYQEETSRRWFDNDQTDLPAEVAVVTMMGMSSVSLINVSTMAGPRTNEEKYIDIRWLSPGDRPVRWLVGASVFEVVLLAACGQSADNLATDDPAAASAQQIRDWSELPDWSGWWEMEGGVEAVAAASQAGFRTGDGLFAVVANPDAYQPEARRIIVASRVPGANPGGTGVYCVPTRFNGGINGGRTNDVEFLLMPQRLTITNGDGLLRRIPIDGRPLRENPEPSNGGTSVGRWEGDTLVIETIGLHPDTTFPTASTPYICSRTRSSMASSISPCLILPMTPTGHSIGMPTCQEISWKIPDFSMSPYRPRTFR